MQHIWYGGVYDPRETVWAFGGAEERGVVPFCDSTRTRTSTFVLRECVPSLFPELAKPLVPAILQSDQSRELPQRKGHRT